MLMAAARIDIPAILVNGGPMLGGPVIHNRKSDTTSIIEGAGQAKKRRDRGELSAGDGKCLCSNLRVLFFSGHCKYHVLYR